MVRLPVDQIESWRPALSGRAVCVTGGCGFIGGHLVDALVGLGAQVRVIDDLSNSSAEHLAGLIDLEPDRVEFIHGSILDRGAMEDAVHGTDLVFHLAAIGSVPRSVRDPRRTWHVNSEGTLRVLEHARAHGVSRVVFSASSSAYGDLGGDAPRVETAPTDPMSPYAASKLAAEALCRAWSASYGVSTVSLRYFNIFGPRQPADSAYAAVIPAFINRMLNGLPAEIEGDGLQSRDFTHVTNAVVANLLAATADAPLSGQVVNVGTGRTITLLELINTIAERLGKPAPEPVHKPARPGDVRGSLADLTRARGLLGYSPQMSFEDGLAETIEWHRTLRDRDAAPETAE